MAAEQEKIENAIAFFAAEHERIARTPLAATFLDRYLVFLDFSCLTSLGRPALGLLHRVTEKGSVLKSLLDGRSTRKIELVPQLGGEYVVKAMATPDLSSFSAFEL